MVITRRGGPQDLIDIADTVTHRRKKKPAFEAGVAVATKRALMLLPQ